MSIRKALADAVALSASVEGCLVCTANRRGGPHVAAGGALRLVHEQVVDTSYWFCPQTLTNLNVNRSVSVVVQEPSGERGYQLTGSVEGVETGAVLDGYAFEEHLAGEVPQVQRRLSIRVEKVLRFQRSAHDDRPL